MIALRREKAWRYMAVRLLGSLEWGDYEYLRKEWRFRYPWVFWLTIYEPSMRRGWRKIMPYRLRTAWACVLIDLLVRRCPGCGCRFTYGELMGRGDDALMRYMSGTTWHKACGVASFKARDAHRAGGVQ